MSKKNFQNDITPNLADNRHHLIKWHGFLKMTTRNENKEKRPVMLIQNISGQGTDFQRQELYE